MNPVVLDLQEFTSVAELLDDPVVTMVLLDDKVAIVPLEIMSEDIDLSGIVECQGIQPFQKISGTRGAWETLGLIVVFGFGHEEISHVLLVGLHGFNIKKHVQGGAGRRRRPPPLGWGYQAPPRLPLVWREALPGVSSFFSSSCLEWVFE